MTVLGRLCSPGSLDQISTPLALFLGGATFAIFSTALSTIGLGSYFPVLVLSILAVLLIPTVRKSRYQIPHVGGNQALLQSLWISPIASLLIIHDQKRALVTFFAAAIATLYLSHVSKNTIRAISLAKHCVVALLFAAIDFLSQSLTRSVSAYSSIIRGSDDIVFSESLSNSLIDDGIRNNLGAIGTGIRYHWLSMAWTGFTSELAFLKPLVGSSLVAPYAALTLGYIALIKLAAAKKMIAASTLLLPVALFVANFGADQAPLFFVMNTSNIFAVTSLLVFTLTLCQSEKGAKKFFLLVVLMFFTILTKVTAGLLAAVLLAIWVATNPNRHTKYASTIFLFITGVVALSAYVIFIKPFGWSQIGYTFVLPNWSVRSLLSLARDICLIPTIALLAIRSKDLKENRQAQLILIAASLFSFPSFFLDGRSGEIYFYVSSLTVVCAVALRVSVDGNFERLSLIYILVTTGIASVASLKGRGFSDSLLVIILGSIFLLTFLKGLNRNRLVKLGLVTALVWSTQYGVLEIPDGSTRLSRDEIFTFEEIELLNDFGDDLNGGDVIATNRFLCASKPCAYDDSSFLISAVTGRKVFIEGPRFVSGGSPYADWISDRVTISLLASQGSPEAIQQLKTKGVTVFWLDKRFGENHTCLILGTIVFDNKNFCAARL
jgi:hypothetical protein